MFEVTTSAGTPRCVENGRYEIASKLKLPFTQTPSWVTSITDPTRLKQVLKNHIDAVIGRYKDDLAYFDIVNEREFMRLSPYLPRLLLTDLSPLALNENGTYKSNVWYNVLGESYIETAVSA